MTIKIEKLIANKSCFLVGMLLIVALLLMSMRPARAAGDEHRFGVLFPLTGPNATYGDIFSQGVNVAVDIINSSNEISGTLKPVYVDSKAQPQAAVVGMNKLVHVDRVPYMLTAFSGVSKAIAPIGNRYHVVMVNGGGVSADLAIGGYFLNDIPLVNQEIKILLPQVAKKKKIRRLAVIYVSDPFGESVDDQIKSECSHLACNIVSNLAFNPDNSNFQGEVTKIRAAHPDAVFIASYGQQEAVITKQLRDGGVKAQLISTSAYGIPDTFKLAASEGAIFDNQHVNFGANSISKKFHQEYLAKYNKEPDFYAVNYGNAVFILADLVKRLQKEGKSISGENLLKALQDKPKFNALGGIVKFSKKGTVKVPMEINVIKNGKPKTMTVVHP